MKIIELHLRNIASIPRADINFDTDLIDLDTNLPAQKFLIYGDTGTGKSVLLDAIALALFKKTPRIEGLESKRQNKFTNLSGSEVNISSIEQYTRLGISDADECYCEVLFVANDGNRYRARLELGLTRGKDKKLKYKKPNWILQAEQGQWEKVDNKGEAVESLIGMNFEQFNRMAMLAQGQFATFLCGDKNERADILERLTNTEIFSRYGDVIKELAKKKEALTQIAHERYETSAQFLLSDEELTQLNEELKADGNAEQAAAAERRRTEQTLTHLQACEAANAKIEEATRQLNSLSSLMQSDAYREKQALLHNWDSTDQERKELELLQHNRSNLEAAQRQEADLRLRFDTLTQGLLLADNELKANEAQLNELKEWLAQRIPRAALYENATVLCEKLEQYRRQSNALRTLQTSLSDAGQRHTALLEKQTAALTTLKAATDALQQHQAGIAALKKSLNELNPTLLDEQLQHQLRLMAAYERLRDDYRQLLDKRQEQQTTQKQLDDLQAQLQEATAQQQQAQNAYNEDNRRYERAMKQYSTLNASLEETLTGLRQRMAEEQTEVCPLCGQHVTKLLSSSEFANVVLPYKEAQEAARRQLLLSQQQLTKANETLTARRTSHQTVAAQLQTLTQAIAKSEAEMEQRLAKGGIAPDGNLLAAIEAKLQQTQQQHQDLTTKKQQANALQQQIEQQSEALLPIEQQQRNADRIVIALKSDLANNDTLQKNLAVQIQQASNTLRDEEQALDSRLQLWFPDWRDKLENTTLRLQQEASEYLDRKRQHDSAESRLTGSREALHNMQEVRRNLLIDKPEWSNPAQQAPQPDKAPTLSDWTLLSNACSTVAGSLRTCSDAIRRSSALLGTWQQQSGKSLADLQALMEHRGELQALRQELIDIENHRAAWAKSLDDAQQALLHETEALKQAFPDTLPDKQQLDARRLQLQADETAAHDRLVKNRERLDTYLRNKQRAEEAQADFARAKRTSDHWALLNKRFGGERFRNLVQTHILRPLLQNANLYLSQITDRYRLTCSEENEQLAILVADRYNRNELRSATILSGGEKFMISLALSLALSSLNRPDMNINILFIDEGFGTLDQKHLDSVMKTLGSLQQIAAQSGRRVGIISHREELLGCIPNKIRLTRIGEGRSRVETLYSWQ